MNRTRCTLALITMIITTSACQSASAEFKLKMPKAPWAKKKEAKQSAYSRPARMVVIWTPDILTQPGKPATRGFGGRIYFYDNRNQTVPVEGQLIVYAFDEALQEHQDSRRPNRAYAFKPEDFANKFSESTIGASYNVWIPWDAQGGRLAKISLIPVFTSTNGQYVVGRESEAVLTGPSPKGSPRQNLGENTRRGLQSNHESLPPQVTPVAYDATVGEQPDTPARRAFEEQRRRLRTTTIDLTQGTVQKLRSEPAPQIPFVAPSSGPLTAHQPSPIINRFGGQATTAASRQTMFPGRTGNIPGQLAQAHVAPGPAPRPAQMTATDSLQQAAASARQWPTKQQRQARFAPNQYQVPTSPSAPSTPYAGSSAPPHGGPASHRSAPGSLFPAR